MKFPLFLSLHHYRLGWLRYDAVAGVTVWAVLVPEALAYATIAGVSPVIGLYAAPAALLLYAAFGSSRHLVTGPMSATAALSAATVVTLAKAGSPDAVTLTAALAVVTGLIAIVAGLLRLGFLANFISEPVLKGFIVGLALTIMIGQVPKLFGVKGAEGDFFQKLWGVVVQLPHTNPLTLVIGLISLALVLGLRRLWPVIPASLVAVLFGILVVAVFGLDKHGIAIVGHIQAGLPHLGVPHAAPSTYLSLAPGAAGVMLVGFAESLGAAKTYAARHHYDVSADRELLGLGAANLAAGLSSGMVVNGSLSKTAVNGAAGARTQLSGLIVAGLTLLTLLFLTPLFADLPEATLAAVVIAAVIELVDIPALVALARISSARLGREFGVAARPDFAAALAALLGVLILDTLPGLFIGIAVSILLLVYRASRPHLAVLGRFPGDQDLFGDVERNPGNQQTPGLLLLRVEGGLFFANADAVRDRVRAEVAKRHPRAVVLDGEAMPYLDVTAVQMLAELADDLKREGCQLARTRPVGQVRDVIRRAENGGRLPTYDSLPEAIAALAPPSEPSAS